MELSDELNVSRCGTDQGTRGSRVPSDSFDQINFTVQLNDSSNNNDGERERDVDVFHERYFDSRIIRFYYTPHSYCFLFSNFATIIITHKISAMIY